jgi:MacB-like protein
LGREIELNGEPFEVIGVMPREYQYPSADFELWTPVSAARYTTCDLGIINLLLATRD